MSIFDNINSLLHNPRNTEASVQILLNGMTVKEQEQLIDAMYLGRDHIQLQKIRKENLPINSNRQSHIPKEDFARILYEKGTNLETYFASAIRCARNSKIDLNEI